MALQGLDSEKFELLLGLWGSPDPNLGEPKDGFTGSEHHNVAAAVYPAGTVIEVRNSGTGVTGKSQFVYLEIGGVDATNGLAAKHICLQCDAGDPYEVSSDTSLTLEADGGTKGAIAISTLTATGYFAWFWCGGVCPEAFVGALGGMYAAETAVPGNALSIDVATTSSTTLGDFALAPMVATAMPIGTAFTTHSAWS